MQLETRTLAPNLPPVARLGLSGSFGIEAREVERAFHELGINYYFVTSRTKGLNEGIRNLVRAGHRDRLVIAAGADLPFGATVGRSMRKLTKLLGVESIDVFHLFWVQAHWYVTGNTWKAMQAEKAKGAAKTLAISCHDRPMARALVDELGLDVLMIRYNAAHRGAEREIFDTFPEKRPGIVAYTATRWGGLLKPVDGLSPMSAPECYRFALAHPKVDVVLCGPRSWAELEEDARGVATGPLSEARLSEVKRFGDAVRSHGTAARVSFGRG